VSRFGSTVERWRAGRGDAGEPPAQKSAIGRTAHEVPRRRAGTGLETSINRFTSHFEDDRGGNGKLVTGECGASNLHSAWDSCLVLKAVGENVNEAATELMKTITPARIESWTHSEPKDWANKSFAIAEQAQTKYRIQQGASCEQLAGKVTIDAAYVVANVPVVRESCRKLASGSRICSMRLWASSDIESIVLANCE
jgi:S1/P1 Nuclease